MKIKFSNTKIYLKKKKKKAGNQTTKNSKTETQLNLIPSSNYIVRLTWILPGHKEKGAKIEIFGQYHCFKSKQNTGHRIEGH